MDIKIISWEQTIPLRQSVLWPNKPPQHCHVEGDTDGLHFGAFVDEKLVCVASVYFKLGKARLRKFATDVSYQQQGIGTSMLQHILGSLNEANTEFFWCDARESAVMFYQRFGMHKCSERFYKDGIAYFKMEVGL